MEVPVVSVLLTQSAVARVEVDRPAKPQDWVVRAGAGRFLVRVLWLSWDKETMAARVQPRRVVVVVVREVWGETHLVLRKERRGLVLLIRLQALRSLIQQAAEMELGQVRRIREMALGVLISLVAQAS